MVTQLGFLSLRSHFSLALINQCSPPHCPHTILPFFYLSVSLSLNLHLLLPFTPSHSSSHSLIHHSLIRTLCLLKCTLLLSPTVPTSQAKESLVEASSAQRTWWRTIHPSKWALLSKPFMKTFLRVSSVLVRINPGEGSKLRSRLTC